jgi:hypothetical protein
MNISAACERRKRNFISQTLSIIKISFFFGTTRKALCDRNREKPVGDGCFAKTEKKHKCGFLVNSLWKYWQHCVFLSVVNLHFLFFNF